MVESTQSQDIEIKIQRIKKMDYRLLQSFTCGNKSLDTFFQNEMELCAMHHYVTPYCAMDRKGQILAIFTLSNDSIIISDSSDKQEFSMLSSCCFDQEYQQIFYQQSMFPAVNIGHLGVLESMQGLGIGSKIIDFVIGTYLNFEDAGCQFITVDALNKSRVKSFYAKAGFNRQSSYDEADETVRMYYPLRLIQSED